MTRTAIIGLAALAAVLVTNPHYSAGSGPSFQDLGTLPGGSHSRAVGVSGNGQVVAGFGNSSSGNGEAFRWTAADGMIGLGDLPGGEFFSLATRVSANGVVVVGLSSGPNNAFGWNEAFRWTAAGGMVALGAVPGESFHSSFAQAVSGDGTVIVGNFRTLSSTTQRAFRWTATGGMASIAGVSSSAFGVSADGSIVVGGFSDFGAASWTSAKGWQTLSGQIEGYTTSIGTARAISADGTTIVGRGTPLPQQSGVAEAFLWTESTGVVRLGDLPGGPFNSIATGVSANGAVVVGVGKTAIGDEAFVWTQATGIRNLREVLIGYGLDLDGWILTGADDVSGDGLSIVGWGTNPEGQSRAWLARLCPDSDGDGVCDVDDLCSDTPMGEGVNADGCSCSQLPPCGEGGLCTINICENGACVAVPVDCSHLDDDCNVGVCDEDGECVTEPRNNGETCGESSDPCNPIVCVNGECISQAVDCSHLDNDCNVGVCDESGECVAEPRNNGEECSDGMIGNICAPKACDNGACISTPIDCSHLDDDCNVGVCDEEGECVTEPRNNGETCGESSDPCNPNVCDNGKCISQPVDCSHLDDDCNVGVCDEFGDCVAVPINDGDACEDGGSPCAPKACDNGACVSTPIDCDDHDPCTTDTCENGDCVNTPIDGCGDDNGDNGDNGGGSEAPIDGNNDGIPDDEQDHVASVQNANGDFVTIVSPNGTTLTNVQSGSNPSPEDTPGGVEFPAGFISFTVQGLAPGAAISIQLILHIPDGTAIDTFYKYGPTPDNPTPHWYEFLFDGTTGVTSISGNVITMTLVDGQRGDADLTANGTIVDPGAPAFADQAAPLPSPGGVCGLCASGATGSLAILMLGMISIKLRQRRTRRHTKSGVA